MKYLFISSLFLWSIALSAQVDSIPPTEEEEDYSLYDNLNFADSGTKRFVTSKVLDLSPQKLISVGIDFQGPYSLNSDTLSYAGNRLGLPQESKFGGSGGLRLGANIPVISKNSIIVQLGFNYWENNYYNANPNSASNPLNQTLTEYGLRTAGLNTTVFKPLNEKQFIIFQGSGDLNGDFTWSNLPSLSETRVSLAGIYGWKPNDRKMIGFGLSRTFRVGEVNIIPVMLLNWTHPNRKWGVEALAPARVHVRRTFNSRSLMLLGYELEGNSYSLFNNVNPDLNFDLRRSELRFRAVYERSIRNFIWLSWQVGYRVNYTFDVDELPGGEDFFRGFFGDQSYAMLNNLGNSFYTMFSINLVSP